MLPALVTNLLWGTPKSEETEETALKHTASEEAGDWLLITPVNTCANSNSRVNSECDMDSVCSDESWVITPAPTFKCSTNSAQQPDETLHPLEDLLMEHPTMSIYRQSSIKEDESEENMNREVESEAINANQRVQNRELVMIQNRQYQELAAQMQIPLTRDVLGVAPKDRSGAKNNPQKLTRKALKRHNPVSRSGIKYQVQKCGFKAGRRRS